MRRAFVNQALRNSNIIVAGNRAKRRLLCKTLKVLFILLLLTPLFMANAQDDIGYRSGDEFRTIFGGKTIGGYGSIGVGYTLVDDRAGVSFDARGGIVLGHNFALGVGGAGFINEDKYVQSITADVSLAGGYGGIFAEFIIFPKSPVHLSFPVLAGIGGVSATRISDPTVNTTGYYTDILETSIFMVVEPAVELEFNFTRYFRMAGYFSYRFTSDVQMDKEYMNPNGLSNYNAGLRFKFGSF